MARALARPLLAIPAFGALLCDQAGCQQRPLAPEPVRMPVTYEAVQALPRRAADREIRYGDEPSQRVSLWHADAGSPSPAPVVVLLHGGCWLSSYGVEDVGPLATALAAQGFGVWAPEYRRVGEPGGGWPGTFEDVAMAIDLLKESGDAGLDPERVVFVGHSAGGHLALWAAARGALTAGHRLFAAAPLAPRGAIGLAAITDLAAYAAEVGGCPQAVTLLMGGGPADRPEDYLAASPASLPRPAPLVLLQGSADPIVPLGQAHAMPGARVLIDERAGHFDWIHPGTGTFAILLEEIRRLLGAGDAPSRRD